MRHTLLLMAAALVASACSTTGPVDTRVPTASRTTDAAPDTPLVTPDAPPAKSAEHSCPEGQFVACADGEACTMRDGSFLEAKRCFTRAAEACSVAACAHGCDIYGTHLGGPQLVLCAPNANSTGHMKVCGGIANWGCPENMRCDFGPRTGFDQQGRCVPAELDG